MPTKRKYEERMVDGVGWIGVKRKRRADKYIAFTFFLGTGITLYELYLTTLMQANIPALVMGTMMMSVAALSATQL
jgi:hypothetical protein